MSRDISEIEVEFVDECLALAREEIQEAEAEHTAAVRSALAHAAMRPGCEVRFTTKSAAQALFYHGYFVAILRRMEMYDAERTQLQQVELLNGSVILIEQEKG